MILTVLKTILIMILMTLILEQVLLIIQLMMLIILIPNITLINDSDNVNYIETEADTDTTDDGIDVVITICLLTLL